MGKFQFVQYVNASCGVIYIYYLKIHAFVEMVLAIENPPKK